jgi:hypothetical protein
MKARLQRTLGWFGATKAGTRGNGSHKNGG